jgi:hypothetical protein
MSAPGSEFESVCGAIVRVQYYRAAFHSVAIVEEKLGQQLFVMWAVDRCLPIDWEEDDVVLAVDKVVEFRAYFIFSCSSDTIRF